MKFIQSLFHVSFLFLVSVGVAAPAFAAAPLAGEQADRQAKSATPAKGEALVYVYRSQDTAAAPIGVTLNGGDAVRLTPRTFTLWSVKPGRIEIGAEGTVSTVVLRADGGRVYYIELTRSSTGIAALRQVSFPVGRTQIQRAQLVAKATEVSRAPPPARTQARASSGLMLALKFGSFSLADESQTLSFPANTYALQFDTSSAFGLEGEYFVRPDTSLGLELFSYSSDYTATSPAASGSADTFAVLFNAKRFFLPASGWQPYVGAGFGAAGVDLSGTISGSTGGLALQLFGGVQWRVDRFALRAEYKYLNADTEDDGGQKVDVSGSGVFIGIGLSL